MTKFDQTAPLCAFRFLLCAAGGGRRLLSLLFAGHLLASETEREILEILGVPWQDPHERVRANVV